MLIPKRRRWIFILSFSLWPFFYTFAATEPLQLRISYDPERIFIKETTAIAIQTEIRDAKGALIPAQSVAIFRLNADKSVREDMGFLYDFGRLGDSVAGDGRFGRKLQISEKKAGTLWLKLVAETGKPGHASLEKEISITVLGRPSFIELIQQLWKRL